MSHAASRSTHAITTLGLALIAGQAMAQCGSGWQAFDPSSALPQTIPANQTITAVGLWDPDGLGAAQSRLVIAAARPASWYEPDVILVYQNDPVMGWQRLPSLGTSNLGRIEWLESEINGDLTALGNYGVLNGNTFNGNSNRFGVGGWSPSSPGFVAGTRSYIRGSAGERYLGGQFQVFLGNTVVQNLVRADFSGFSQLGNITPGPVNAVARNIIGELFVGGAFTSVGGVNATNVARLSFGTWQPIGPGLAGGEVTALAVLPSGELVASGSFTAPPGRMARWDGTAWQPMGSGLDAPATRLHVRPSGDLIAVGPFTTAGGQPAAAIARWDGSAWSALGAGLGGVAVGLVDLPTGELVAAGPFSSAGTAVTRGVAAWNGVEWTSRLQSSGLNGPVRVIRQLSGNRVAIGGDFSSVGTTAAPRIAMLDRSTGLWSPLGSPVGATDGSVNDILELPSGQILAAGSFTTIAGVAAPRIALWNGSAWTSINTITAPGSVSKLQLTPAGVVLVGGSFSAMGNALGTVTAGGIARWSPSAGWSAVPQPPTSIVNVVYQTPTGDIIAGQDGAGIISRLSGASWQQLGGFFGSIFDPQLGSILRYRDTIPLASGEFALGGAFNFTAPGLFSSSVARWDGSAWRPYSFGINGTVNALLQLPSGDLLAAGNFSLADGGADIARWDGQRWLRVGEGFDNAVLSLARLNDGTIVAGGTFLAAGATPTPYLASLSGGLVCYANCDCSTGAAALSPADFSCFLARYRAGDAAANCDQSTATPVLTPSDFTCFLAKYRAGCP